MAQKKKIDYQRTLSYPAALAELRKKDQRIAELELMLEHGYLVNLQNALDCSVMELHEEFGFGPVKNKRFTDGMLRRMVEYMQMSLKEVRETEQGKNCEDFWVTQAKMDNGVRAALGPDVPAWEERYSFERLIQLMARLKQIVAGK